MSNLDTWKDVEFVTPDGYVVEVWFQNGTGYNTWYYGFIKKGKKKLFTVKRAKDIKEVLNILSSMVDVSNKLKEKEKISKHK